MSTRTRTAQDGLAELEQARQALHDEVRAAERARDFDLTAGPRDQLAQLERRRLGGEDLAREITAAEKRLAKAQARAQEPWAERVSGARAALRDAEQRLQHFVAERWGELAAELAEEATAAADHVDRALADVIAAHAEREQVASRFTQLAATIGRVHPNLFPTSLAEPVVREANRLLEAGGERAPVPSRDPRQPRHGTVAA